MRAGVVVGACEAPRWDTSSGSYGILDAETFMVPANMKDVKAVVVIGLGKTMIITSTVWSDSTRCDSEKGRSVPGRQGQAI
jgi:hypothetical protein